MIYLAAPYTHINQDIVEQRMAQVNKYAADLMRMGLVVYSPLSHGHAIASLVGSQLPTDWEFWRKQTLPLLHNSKIMVLLQLEGWEHSKGVQEELLFAENHYIPVLYVEI